MAPRQILTIDGRKFKIYEKSIYVEGVVPLFYFARPVTEFDCRHLAKLIELGRKSTYGGSRLLRKLDRT